MIDKATADKIKDTADIVEVVSDYVKLIRRGANYMGLCPFHNERTPSFSVSPRRNFCYCFSCHKGGSPVNFIMEKEGISYHDALLQLAKKYGITVEEKELTEEQLRQKSLRESMFVANEWAMNKMENDLRQTDEGKDVGLQYFYSRGLTEDAIRNFHLGYALDSSDALTSAAVKAGFDINVLKSTGLTGTSQNGNDYDRFRGRVIFPIFNSSGKVVAFGGRDLKGGLAKYVNSPESEIYKKSNELYGIFQARQSIIKEDKCYLVEGYMDVIGMWQSGMKNTVASSGTALTDGQIALIHRFTKNVTLIYDGDAAGIKAALRGMDMLLMHKLNVRVLLLPDGHDPDSFARQNTPEQFEEYVKQHETDIIRFKIKVLSSDIDGDPMKRVQVIKSVVRSVACIPDKVERDVYVQECSRLLGVSEDTILSELLKAREEVITKIKQERNRKDFPVNVNAEAIGARSAENGIATDKPAEKKSKGSTDTHENALLPVELKIIEQCLKYGFMDFCRRMVEEEPGSIDSDEGFMSVIEFIDSEMKADQLQFTSPQINCLFNELMSILPEFRESLKIFKEELSEKSKLMRAEGMEKIALKGGAVSELQAEEEILNERIINFEKQKTVEFSKDYPSRKLASHENDSIRALVNSLISQRHTLSQRFLKMNSSNIDTDLLTIVPRAIVEWKVEILDQRIKEILNTLSNESDSADMEKTMTLQSTLNNLIRIRSSIARDAGERIIAPQR